MVLAVNTTNGQPFTGDAANITAKISIDFGSFASLTDTNPTELDSTNAAGVYVFDLSQAETNGDVLTIMPSSSTANVQIDMLNIYTSSVTGYTPEQIADQVWDEPASQHNVGGSFGKFLRQVKEGLIVIEATVDDSSATTTSFITTLSSGVDNFYNDDTLVFISGSLTGQSRIIQDYNGSELRVTFDEPLTSAPADTDEFILLAGHNLTLTQIENQVWDATLGDHQTNGSTGKGLVDAAATGGDATLANQTAILAKLQTNPIEITNPLVDSSTLVLINHDNYSSNNSRLITFPVTTDYSTATNVKLIFESNGTNIKIASAVVASATSITVDLEVDFGSSLSFTNCSGAVCNRVATCEFALVATYGTDQESIARGTAYIYDRATEV